jgi:ribonuclease H2 subunit A
MRLHTAQCRSSRRWRKWDLTVRPFVRLDLMADSKVLSHDVRQRLWESFTTHPPLCYSSTTLSPQGISAGMLRRVPINLNRQAEVS